MTEEVDALELQVTLLENTLKRAREAQEKLEKRIRTLEQEKETERQAQRAIRDFIVANRRAGTTTSLVHLTIERNGILVVGSNREKTRLLKEYPDLKNTQVIQLRDLAYWQGRITEARPVFFDTHAVHEVCGKD